MRECINRLYEMYERDFQNGYEHAIEEALRYIESRKKPYPVAPVGIVDHFNYLKFAHFDVLCVREDQIPDLTANELALETAPSDGAAS